MKKNNTLYIGPYRQRDPIGLWSQSLLINLNDNPTINLHARPIYTHPEYATSAIINTVADIETRAKEPNSKYNTVIQHVPLSYARIIDEVDNNIIIPILDDQVLSDDNYNKLMEFDKIYIDNKQDYIKLTQFAGTKLNKLITSINYEKYISNTNKTIFDVGALGHTKKLYHISNYSQNIKAIHQIVTSYIYNIKYAVINHLSLILFVLDISIEDKNNLNKFINQCYEFAGCDQAINRIVVAPITSDINNICIAHNTGDVYLSLHDYGSDSMNTKLAQGFKKQILLFDTKYISSFSDSLGRITNGLFVNRSDDAVNNAVQNFMSSGHVAQDNTKQKSNFIHTLSLS